MHGGLSFEVGQDAAADARTDVLHELLVAHFPFARRVVEVDNLNRFFFGHR